MLAACGPESAAPEGQAIECAVGAGAELQSVCTLELEEGGDSFVVHHPDGGFRRFEPDQEGGFSPADGAEPVSVAVSLDETPAHVTYSVGDDSYRIPQVLLPAVPDD